MLIEELQKLPHSDLLKCNNYYLIPTFITGISDEGARLFNQCLALAQEICEGEKILRTNSGGISTKTIPPAYDVRNTKSMVELTLISRFGCYRIQFRIELEDSKLSGRKAFEKLKKMLMYGGVNLDDYAIDEELGIEIKKKIPNPLISLVSEEDKDKIFDGVHHIDFHSSYPAGLINTHPEFAPTIKRIYNRRKTDETCKAILNYSIGYMQSISCCGARWSYLSKDAIEDNNIRLLNLANLLEEKGRKVLLFNTDGLWYQGEIFHSKGEGDDIGQWHNDHINCRFRAKSDGAYEFIEDGKYHPVIRGITNESKKGWKWGDIYTKGNNLSFYSYEEGKGITKDGKKL